MSYSILYGGSLEVGEFGEIVDVFIVFKTEEDQLADNIDAFFSTKQKLPQVLINWMRRNGNAEFMYHNREYQTGVKSMNNFFDWRSETYVDIADVDYGDRKEIFLDVTMEGEYYDDTSIAVIPYSPEDEFLSEFYNIVSSPMIKSAEKTASALLEQSHGDIEAAARVLASKMNDVKASPFIRSKKLKGLKQRVVDAEQAVDSPAQELFWDVRNQLDIAEKRIVELEEEKRALETLLNQKLKS